MPLMSRFLCRYMSIQILHIYIIYTNIYTNKETLQVLMSKSLQENT